MSGRVSLEALRDAVDRPVRDAIEPYVLEASLDTIRLFARAYGDDNPLYSDAAYACAGPRGRLVAPPLFPIATGAPVPLDDADGPIDLEAFGVGTGQTIAGDRWLLCRPIDVGVRLQRDKRIHRVDLDPPAGAEAEGCTVTVRTTFRGGGEVYAVNDRIRRYEVGAAPPAGDGRTKATYNPDELDRIDRAVASAGRRGALVRWFEDVNPGDSTGVMVKGPMTVTDLVAYRGGVGPGPLGGEALRLAYLNRQVRPHVYNPDFSGTPDITERRHYDEPYAQRLGFAGAYDYSHTRLTWLSHLVGDWMGDAAWLWSLSGTTTLANNYVGDTHWLDGEVESVERQDGFGAVSLALRGRNQLGQITCTADATVLLPTRGRSHVTDRHLARFGAATEPGW